MNKKAIGLRIRKIREGLGLTQQEFGKLLNLSHASVSGYELGDSYPSVDCLIKIAELGRISIAWLVTGNSEVGSLESSLPRDGIRLLKTFLQASEEDRRVILRVAEAIAGKENV